MLNRAPSVYVPVEPEDNGIALPAVLSLIVHIAILAFIVFFHRAPKIDEPDPIETSIVTPEELAAIQSNIISNREAQALSADSVDISPSTTTDTINPNQNQTTQPAKTRDFSSIFFGDEATSEPVETTVNPFEDTEIDDKPTDENAQNNETSEDPLINDIGTPTFGTKANPTGQKPALSESERKALKQNLINKIRGDIFRQLNQTGIPKVIVTIRVEPSYNLNISIKSDGSPLSPDHARIIKEAINKTNSETSYFIEAYELEYNPIQLTIGTKQN